MTNLAIAHAIKLRPLLILAGIAYGVLVGALWGWQNRLIFEPQTELPYTPEDYNLSYLDVNIPVGAGSLHGWWIEGGKPVLLFLHGNSGNVSTNLPQAVRFVRLGFSVLMVDYRGYGISAGEQPSEQRVHEDAEAAYRFLLERHRASRYLYLWPFARRRCRGRARVTYQKRPQVSYSKALSPRSPMSRGCVFRSSRPSGFCSIASIRLPKRAHSRSP